MSSLTVNLFIHFCEAVKGGEKANLRYSKSSAPWKEVPADNQLHLIMFQNDFILALLVLIAGFNCWS